MKENSYPSFEHLPMSLNAEDISKVLNISIGNAYNLLHREDFPTIHIGKRMIVPAGGENETDSLLTHRRGHTPGRK